MFNFKTAMLFAAFTLVTTACAGYESLGPTMEETFSENDALASDGTGEQTAAEIIPAPAPLPQPQEQALLSKYDHLDPGHEVPTDLLKKAVLYFDANQAKFPNKNYISVIDFAKNSKQKRFFIVDLKTGKVWGIHTAHGKGSDPNHDGLADSFSNTANSNKSSLGVYKTAETYTGKHGRSLRLDGLSSTNSNVRARAIVIHGASYVSEASVIQGRSFGCPAVAENLKDKVIDQLKGGSMIYAGLGAQ